MNVNLQRKLFYHTKILLVFTNINTNCGQTVHYVRLSVSLVINSKYRAQLVVDINLIVYKLSCKTNANHTDHELYSR